jgi:hypothetical protein
VICSLFGWLVTDDWCWFVLREEYCCLVAGSWFVLREKYCWLVADKPSEQTDDDPTQTYMRFSVHVCIPNKFLLLVVSVFFNPQFHYFFIPNK